MTAKRDPETILAAWLDEGPTDLPDATRRAILTSLPATPQARRGPLAPWRTFLMSSRTRLAAGALAVAVVAAGGLFLLGTNGTRPGGPLVSASAAPSPTLAPSPSPGALDTSTWVAYTSARYGFTISHPADWTSSPSTRLWVFPADASFDPTSTAWEAFRAPADTILVTAWSVAVAPGTTALAWIANSYCQVNQVATPSDQAPCDRFGVRSWPVTMDGHSGTLIQFADDTQAFVLVNGRMYIVAVWEPATDPRTAPFGGAQRLLKAFLSTMHLLPGGPAPETSGPAPS